MDYETRHMVALRDFLHDGQDLSVGQPFWATAVDAGYLYKHRKADYLAVAAPAPAPVATTASIATAPAPADAADTALKPAADQEPQPADHLPDEADGAAPASLNTEPVAALAAPEASATAPAVAAPAPAPRRRRRGAAA